MTRDSLFDIFQDVCGEAAAKWAEQGLSEEEIATRLSPEKMADSMQCLVERAAGDHHDFFMKKRFEISHREQIKADTFLAHQNEIWGDCFTLSETMYVMAVEAAEWYTKFVAENISNEKLAEKQYTIKALQYMQGRCCQEFLEILYLMKLGFADCAYARWRSMYELCCSASFIVKRGETIAKKYVKQSQTLDKSYNWANGARKADGTELKDARFWYIQKDCTVDHKWKEEYDLSCFINHGSPQGTFRRLCLKDDQEMVVVGQSDYGITTPAEHSAVSLQWITSMYLNVFPSLDALAYIRVIQDWVEEIREAYFNTSDKCFGTSINYHKKAANNTNDLEG